MKIICSLLNGVQILKSGKAVAFPAKMSGEEVGFVLQATFFPTHYVHIFTFECKLLSELLYFTERRTQFRVNWHGTQTLIISRLVKSSFALWIGKSISPLKFRQLLSSAALWFLIPSVFSWFSCTWNLRKVLWNLNCFSVCLCLWSSQPQCINPDLEGSHLLVRVLQNSLKKLSLMLRSSDLIHFEEAIPASHRVVVISTIQIRRSNAIIIVKAEAKNARNGNAREEN